MDHGFSTRVGGISRGPYTALNLGLTVDDGAVRVIENRRAFGNALGVDAARIVVPKQVHSNKVVLVDASSAGCGALDHASAIDDADALITSTPEVTLALHFADCVSIFFLDPAREAIGLAHAGWRGTAAGIVGRTVEAMRESFGTNPRTLLAAIGPAIGRCCYDVGEDVASELFRVFPHDERVLKQSQTDKWRADLKTANLLLLKEAGLDERNIAVSDECTSCNMEEFFSFRRDDVTGRMGGWICLRRL